MLNYFEFEGEFVKATPKDGNKVTYLWLEGFTPNGYTTMNSFEINEKIYNEIANVNKHTRISICGHIEVRSYESGTGKIRKNTYLVVDKIIEIKASKGIEIG